MQRTLVSLALLGLLPVGAARLEAQAPAGTRDRGAVEVAPAGLRSGFFFSATVGAGSEQNRFSDEPDYTSSLTKPTFMIRMGGTPDPSVRLGAEFFGWWNPVPDGTETFGTALVTVQFYPAPTAGFYLKAGGGIAESGIHFDYYPDNSEVGFAWSAGVGYDFPLTPQISIGPTIDFYQGTFTKRYEATLSERVMNFGVQISFQTGRH